MILVLAFMLLAGFNYIIMADESHQQFRPDSASKYERLHAQKNFTADESIMQRDLPGDAWKAASAKFSQTRCKQISIINFEINLSRENHTYNAQIHLYVKADGAHFLDVTTVAVDIDKQRAETTAINKATAKVVQETYISLEHFCNDPSSFVDDGTRPQQ